MPKKSENSTANNDSTVAPKLTEQSIKPIDDIYQEKTTKKKPAPKKVTVDKDIVKDKKVDSDSTLESILPNVVIDENIGDADSSNVVATRDAKDGEVAEITPKINIRKLGEPKEGAKLNKFDMFFIKLWSYIVSAVIGISSGINYCINGIFKRKAPDKYVRAFVSAVLIICIVLLFTLPFRISISSEAMVDIYGDGMIAVQSRTHLDESGYPVYKWGYANKKGNMVIAPTFEEALPFMHGVAWVRKRELIKDSNNQTLIDDYWYLIDKKGKAKGKTQLKFDSTTEIGANGRPVGNFTPDVKLAWVIKSGYYAYINTSGNIKIDAKFKYAEDFAEGYARVREGQLEYYIDKNGKAICDPYEEVKTFAGGLGAVKRNEVWGFINAKGKMVIPPSYEQVSSFKGEYAAVRRGNTYGIIDKKGDIIVPILEYYDINTVSQEFRELILSIRKK